MPVERGGGSVDEGFRALLWVISSTLNFTWKLIGNQWSGCKIGVIYLLCLDPESD